MAVMRSSSTPGMASTVTSSRAGSTRAPRRRTATSSNLFGTCLSTPCVPASAPTRPTGGGAATPPWRATFGPLVSLQQQRSSACSRQDAELPRARSDASSLTVRHPDQWLFRSCPGSDPGRAFLAHAVGAGEAVGEEAHEERGGEADDVEIVAVDALDEGGAAALDRIAAGAALPL